MLIVKLKINVRTRVVSRDALKEFGFSVGLLAVC